MKTKITISLLAFASFLFITNVSKSQGFSVTGTNTFTNPLANLVGIGTATPLGTLDVLSAINSPSWTYFRGNVNATKPSTTFTGGGLGIGYNYEGNCELDFVTGPADCGTSGGYRFQDWAYSGSGTITNLVTILSAGSGGKVGIGTTTPTNILSFGNAAARKIWIENTASGTVGRDLTVAAGSTVGGTNITGGNNIIQAGLGTGNGASTISFQNGTTLGSGTTLQTMSEKMTILGNGNVGIGTTSPGTTLEIDKPVAGASTPLYITNSSASSGPSSSLFIRTPNATSSSDRSWGFITNYNVHGDFEIQESSSNSTNPSVARMTFASGGNVGIGTTAPGFSLDINKSTATLNLDGITGGLGNSGARINMLGWNATNKNWQIGVANIGYDGLMFTPSTAAGGATFTTPSVIISGAGNVGIGTTAPTALLSVNGTVNCVGGGTWGTFCDVRLKKDTSAFTDGLEVIKKIHPINYRYNGKMGIKDTSSTFVGVVAQQIQQVAPYTVTTFMAKLDTADTQETQLLTYNPNALFYLFVNAFKELDSVNVKKDSVSNSLLAKAHVQDSINSSLQSQLIANNTILQNQVNQLVSKDTLLQNQLMQLMTTINNCCNHSQSLMDNGNNGNTKSMSIGTVPQGEATQIDVKLNDVQTVVLELEQNIPNPFQEETTINYTLPDNTVKAQMLFYNAQGKLIQSVDLVQKGKGQLNVFASDLSNGIYTYTLVVDGKIIDSKKMIRSK